MFKSNKIFYKMMILIKNKINNKKAKLLEMNFK